MPLDYCIHIANLFYLASFLCRDILWLRLLTCAGLVFGIIFFCAQTEAMFTPAAWMAVFLGVNLFQIGRILRERDAMQLSPEQTEVGRLLLQRLSRQELLNLLTKSLWDSDRSSSLLEQTGRIELNQEQQFVRDVAFDRLSDQELMNLIIRRFWRSLRRRDARWLKLGHPQLEILEPDFVPAAPETSAG